MKTQNLMLLVLTMLVTVQCSSSKKAVEQTAPVKEKIAAEEPNLVAIARARFPEATAESLAAGKNIYSTKCTQCHGPKRLSGPSEEKWLRDIDNMAPKAHLSAEETKQLTQFVLTAREIGL